MPKKIAETIPRVKPNRVNRRWPTASEYADQYGITFGTVYRWVREGRLRAVKIGPGVRIVPEGMR